MLLPAGPAPSAGGFQAVEGAFGHEGAMRPTAWHNSHSERVVSSSHLTLDVILGVGMKTLSNYINHIAHTTRPRLARAGVEPLCLSPAPPPDRG